MERWSGMHYIHTDEERDEDYSQRMSMCLSIDISEMIENRFHSFGKIFDTERRNPGGGLFGTAEGKYSKGSRVSLTVPNKFYARKRSGLEKYCKKPSIQYGVNLDANSRKDIYKPERYSRYNDRRVNALPPRPNLIDPYECPNPLSYEPYKQQHYTHPSFKQSYANPDGKYYRRKAIPDVVREQTAKCGYKWDYPKERDYRSKKHYGTLQNTQISNSFYECDFPNKIHNRPYNSHTSEYPEYNLDRKRKRQPSGYTNTDYMKVPYHNQHDCYTDANPREKYAPECDTEWNYNPIPNLRNNYYPEPALHYDSDYDDDSPEMYRRSPYQKKSVEFLGIDCEIPYNILKAKRNALRAHKQNYEYPDSFPCYELLSVDIPFKERKPNHFANFDDDFDCGRRESGFDCCNTTKPMCRNLNYDSDLCHNCNKYYKPHKKPKRSLKEKISDMFRRSKSKCMIPSKQSVQRCVSNFNNIISCKSAMSKCGSNASRIVSPSKNPRCPQRKPNCVPIPTRKNRCNVYPTVYRVTRRKVNNSDLESAHDDSIKGCCEYYREPMPISQPDAGIARDAGYSCAAMANASCSCNIRDDHVDVCQNPNVHENSECFEGNVASSTMDCCNEAEHTCVAAKPQGSSCSLGLTDPEVSSPKECPMLAQSKSFPTEHKVSFAQLHSEQEQISAPGDSQVSNTPLPSDSQCLKSNSTISEPCHAIPELSSCPQTTAATIHLENDYGSVRNNQCICSPDTVSNSIPISKPKSILSTCNHIKENISFEPDSSPEPAGNAMQCCTSSPARVENANVDAVGSCSKSQEACGNSCQAKDAAPSYLEDLKRELLMELQKEQRMNAQLPYLNPTPHIMIFPSAPVSSICPARLTECCSCIKCWRPL